MARRVAIEHRGARIVVEYRPELFDDPGFRALVLVSWNVSRAGRPVPIAEQSIADVSLALTAAIVRGVAADVVRMKVNAPFDAPLPWIPRSGKERRL